jgi:hypothetical protein
MARNLTNTSAPALPFAPTAYSREYQDILNNILRIYLLSVDNAVNNLLSGAGGQYLAAPYGAFQDSTDQIAANTTTAYAVTFNKTDFSNTVFLSNNSRINVEYPGIYNLQFSIQFKNTTNDSQDVDVWFRKNGGNVPESNSRFALPPRKSSGDPSHLIAALNFFLELGQNDYVEIMWRVTNVGVSIEHYPTSTAPDRPAVPSAIATLSFVSRLP